MDTSFLMTPNPVLNQSQLATLNVEVEAFNKQLSEGRVRKQELDKDDFLKILLTQLTHQDPTKPMEDKEFIAQMAQFSTLEQMTNMNKEITAVANNMTRTNALSLLGRMVEVVAGDELITGTVEKVMGGETPLIQVNGKLYDYNAVESVTVAKEASL